MALLGLCFVEQDGVTVTPRLPVMTLLDRLEHRFGLLVARAPAALDSAEARSGAAENLTAFCRKLQLLGCFQGLSDDLSLSSSPDRERTWHEPTRSAPATASGSSLTVLDQHIVDLAHRPVAAAEPGTACAWTTSIHGELST